MLCPKCNGEVNPGSTYCLHCGAQLAPSGQTVETAQPESVAPRAPRPPGKWVIVGIALLVGAIFATAFGVGVYFLVRSGSDPGSDGEDGSDRPTSGSTTPTTAAPGTSPGVRRGGVLTLSLGLPEGVDPMNAWESEGIQITQCLFDSLVAFDPLSGEVRPAAAESWDSNEDASVWTFSLVEGAEFHDGTPVTAADFKYAWERICDPVNDSPISYHLSAVKGYEAMQAGDADSLEGVEAVDDRTLRVTLSYPFADFLLVAGHPSLAPVPRQVVEADPAAYSDLPVGNGPFALAQPWTADFVISLVRFDGYYGKEVYLDGVEFEMFEDEESAYAAFLDGGLDVSPVPEGQLEAALATYGESEDGMTVVPGGQVLTGPEAAVSYLFLNTRDELLSNVKLRQALSLAIDRQAFSDAYYEGTYAPATSIIPSCIPGYLEGAWPYVRYDVGAAKKALADAGYPGGGGLPEIYAYVGWGASVDSPLTMIRDDLEAIGVTLVLQEVDYDQYVRRLESGRFMAGYAGWIADYPSIDAFLYPLFATASADNNSLWNDRAFELAIAKARAVTDDAERLSEYQELVKAVGEATPVIPLLQYSHRVVGSARMHGFVLDLMGLVHPESVWLEGGGLPALEGDGSA